MAQDYLNARLYAEQNQLDEMPTFRYLLRVAKDEGQIQALLPPVSTSLLHHFKREDETPIAKKNEKASLRPFQ